MKALVIDGEEVVMRIEEEDDSAGGVCIVLFDVDGRHAAVIDRAERRRVLAWLTRLNKEESAR